MAYVAKSVYFKNDHIFVDGEDKGAVLSEKPEIPAIYQCYKKTVTYNGVDYVQMWVWRGDSWLCFADTDIEVKGAFNV